MTHLPRGIDPELLLSQVKNTMPYLFQEFQEGEKSASDSWNQFVPALILRGYDQQLSSLDAIPKEVLSHLNYFRLCVSSHYSTCGTPVPTDVDNQIRRKLWPAELPLETALQMVQFVLDSRKWDFTCVSTRFIYGALGTPWEKEVLSGHLGEWFTLSCGAYCALKHYAEHEAAAKRQELFSEIAEEIRRHSEIFGSLWSAGEGLSCLKASASIAHNLGDLDRVMDMWDLDYGDPLRLQFYKLASSPFDLNKKLRYLGRLWVAGELYKTVFECGSMAFENHRHFALRKPKCLRKSPRLLIPTAPFLDDWGMSVAQFLKTSDGQPSVDTLEVVEALRQGWDRLPNTVGYGRALRGILEVHPDLQVGSISRVRGYQTWLDLPQVRFEKKWSDLALREMEEIPSRA